MRQVRFAVKTALPSLVDNKLEAAILLAVSDAKYRILSITMPWTLADMQVANQGGLMVGLAHGDYTAQEIEDCIEANTSINQGNMIAKERASRRVRVVGTFPSADNAEDDVVLNDGKPITTKLNWVIPIGVTVSVWWYNNTGTTFTSANLLTNGTAIVKFA